MFENFTALADRVEARLPAGLAYTATVSGEQSDFVRFNRAKVRQPGEVRQAGLSLRLIDGRRQTAGDITLTGLPEADSARVDALLDRLAARLPLLPEDPHLLINPTPSSSHHDGANALPDATAVVDDVLAAAHAQGKDPDLVGVYAQGNIYRGFASSTGQRNWFSTWSYNLDWCLVAGGDKAVKSGLAGFAYDPAALQSRMAEASRQLAIFSRPARTIEPGRYRVFLSPAAVGEILGLLNWGAFSARAVATRTSPLMRLVEGKERLHESVNLCENTRDGVAAAFQEDGFVKPDLVPLWTAGQHAGTLVSPRSAAEYGQSTNGASAGEQAVSLDLAAGDLPTAEALARLGTGVYIGNLWYLNYSDRNAARMTGMTRFATFWVENGEIVAPLNVMRFDETVGNILGANLEGLTAERDLRLSSDTYFARSTDSARLPGALVRDFTFTL